MDFGHSDIPKFRKCWLQYGFIQPWHQHVKLQSHLRNEVYVYTASSVEWWLFQTYT